MNANRTPERELWVVLPAQGLPRWASALLERLHRDGLSLVSIVLDEPNTASSRWNALIDALDQRLFAGADTASAASDAAQDTLFAAHHTQASLATLTAAASRPATALNFSTIEDPALAETLGLPVLSLQPSADADWRDTPVGLWECLEAQAAVGLRVVHSTPAGEISTVMSASECTDPVSVGRTRHAALWAGAELLYRALTCQPDINSAPELKHATPRHRGQPTVMTALVHFPWHIAKGVWRKFSRRKHLRQWILLWHKKNTSETTASFDQWQHILPPRDVFWADPFVVERDNQHFLFIEEATFTPRRGHLSVMPLHDDGRTGDPVQILKKPYHLSYPNVFNHGDQWYMMPESGEAKCLQLYRCDRWPSDWSWQCNLIDDLAVYDGTLLEHNGKWWLFGTVQEFEESSPNVFLHLWHSDSPLGPWTPHRANPVCTDVSRARPAGNFFTRDGVLYRPSQNCGNRYGYGLQINRVDNLDEHSYVETTVQAYTPWSSDIDAVHTLNETATHQLADAVLWRAPDLKG